MAERTIRCEVLVIGSGPGGANTASMLAEAGHDVVLVEEGPDLPLDSAAPYTLAEMNQKYRHGGLTATFGKANITYLEGRCVGGASEINAALHHPPLPATLGEWQLKYQIRDFSAQALQPWFQQVEQQVSVCLQPHGPGPASARLREGAQRLGWTANEVARYWRYPEGAHNSNEGSRQSMSQTLIPRAQAAGCRLHADTRIRHLVMDGGRATAAEGRVVHGEARGQRVRIHFSKVFLCAGAVQTPLVLRRSGIRRGVGNSLRIHPMIRIAARFDEPVNDPSWGVPVVQVEHFKPHLTLGCSHSSLPHIAMWMGSEVPGRKEALADWRNIAIYYALVTGRGRGFVRNLPGFDEPFIFYQFTSQDAALLREGLYRLGQLVFEAGASEFFHPVEGEPAIRTRADLERIRTSLPVEKTSLSTIHLFGSCPMGEHRGHCTVDSWGRLFGYDNIWLNDSSILPNTPGVNPQGTIMAIARRNAHHWLRSN